MSLTSGRKVNRLGLGENGMMWSSLARLVLSSGDASPLPYLIEIGTSESGNQNGQEIA